MLTAIWTFTSRIKPHPLVPSLSPPHFISGAAISRAPFYLKGKCSPTETRNFWDNDLMTIKEQGKGDYTHLNFEYTDAGSFDNLDPKEVRQVYAVCFYDDKMIIGFGGKKNDWGLIGGTIEPGESYIDTLKREIKEESNMEVLTYAPIGYQKVKDATDSSNVIQLRYACKVRPYGEFKEDPAGSILEIKLIDPKEYKKYFDWGQIGERIIQRAIELKSSL